MPAVGDLGCLRQRCGCGKGVPTTAITSHNGDLRLTREPGSRRRRLAVGQQRDGPAPLQIADERPVALVPAPCPVIDADDRRRNQPRAAAPSHDTQDSILADGRHQPLRQTACRPATERDCEMMDELVQAVGPTCLTAELLKDALPTGATAETIRRHLHQVAARTDAELGDEQPAFVDGCPSIWNELPHSEGPIVVGIDGSFVRNWHDKANHFEVVVGKSVPEDRDDRYFGFVQNHDPMPKRRLFEVLHDQGLQMNQEITFLTDGGDQRLVRADRRPLRVPVLADHRQSTFWRMVEGLSRPGYDPGRGRPPRSPRDHLRDGR
jgi:hypothetical protein